jgi:hypothetical protein
VNTSDKTFHLVLRLATVLLKKGAAEENFENHLTGEVLATLAAAMQHHQIESLAQEVKRWSDENLPWKSYDDFYLDSSGQVQRGRP